jgi:hypothetical protein
MARKVSSSGVIVSNSMSGKRFGYNHKSMAQRTYSSGNNYRIWTRNTHHTSRVESDKVLTLDRILKDNVDAKLVDPIQSSSDARHNGPTFQVILKKILQGHR